MCWLLGGPGLIIHPTPFAPSFSCHVERHKGVEPELMLATREDKNPQVAVFD